VAQVGQRIVGRASIRHDLNDWLRAWGGHIGYCVRPADRRRGYATMILQRSLRILAELGLVHALLVCTDDNVGSATVIERCGGVLEDVRVDADGTAQRRYWIDLAGPPKAAIEDIVVGSLSVAAAAVAGHEGDDRIGSGRVAAPEVARATHARR
jgi:hypothetical protein